MPDWAMLLITAVIASGTGWITVRGAKRLNAAQADKTQQEAGDIQDKRIADLQERVDDVWQGRNEAMKMVEEERGRREELEGQVHDLLEELASLKEELAKREERIQTLERENASCKLRISALEKELREYEIRHGDTPHEG